MSCFSIGNVPHLGQLCKRFISLNVCIFRITLCSKAFNYVYNTLTFMFVLSKPSIIVFTHLIQYKNYVLNAITNTEKNYSFIFLVIHSGGQDSDGMHQTFSYNNINNIYE